jgi:hypothetical protein
MIDLNEKRRSYPDITRAITRLIPWIAPGEGVEMKALFSVIYKPYATFVSLRHNRAWAAPVGVLVALSLAAALLQLPTVVRDSLNALKYAVAIGEISPLHYDEAMQTSVTVFSTLGGAVLAIPLQVFLGALALMLVNMLVRGTATYGDMVNVALYASVPGVIGNLIIGFAALIMKADSLSEVMPDASIFVEHRDSLLGLALGQIHPFSCWSVCLLIVGLHVMCKKPWPLIGLLVLCGWIGLSIGMASMYFHWD